LRKYEALSAKRVGDGAGNKENLRPRFFRLASVTIAVKAFAVMSGSELVGCHSDLFVEHELEACSTELALHS
jgi:hypothetical protein